MEMLPVLYESSPSSKFLQKYKTLQSGGRTHAHGMVGLLIYSLIAQQCSVLAIFSFMVLFIAGAKALGSWRSNDTTATWSWGLQSKVTLPLPRDVLRR
jgi:hypothetical protein